MSREFGLPKPFGWLLLGLIPCLGVLLYQFSAQASLDSLRSEAFYLTKKLASSQRVAQLETELLEKINAASKTYISDELETMELLLSEVNRLEAKAAVGEGVPSRLNFLQNGQNDLKFREQNFQQLGNFQEVEVNQLHPVEMDAQDLAALLAKIENVTIEGKKGGTNPPELIVKEFELIRKPLGSKEESYLIQFKLIKREIVHE